MPEASKSPAADESSGRDALLQFTVLVSGLNAPEEVEAYARERGWIDAEGNRTPAGIELSKALADQSGTRSAFRGT